MSWIIFSFCKGFAAVAIILVAIATLVMGIMIAVTHIGILGAVGVIVFILCCIGGGAWICIEWGNRA